MPLSHSQQRVLEEWMRSKAIIKCPLCGQDRWRFAEATYVRALLEEGDEDLTEGGGVVKILCDDCGHLVLFDAETVGIRGVGLRGGTCSVLSRVCYSVARRSSICYASSAGSDSSESRGGRRLHSAAG